jgi:hypothetical protein
VKAGRPVGLQVTGVEPDGVVAIGEVHERDQAAENAKT